MLDIGWTELLVIGALALIVVGPRDLPQLLRTVGQAAGKIRRMAREFQRSMEDAAREADVASFKELRDLKKDMGGVDFRQQAAKAQSYLNQPVKAEAKGAPAEAGKAAPAGAGAAELPAGTPASPAEPAADGPAPPAEPPEPRQAGAKG